MIYNHLRQLNFFEGHFMSIFTFIWDNFIPLVVPPAVAYGIITHFIWRKEDKNVKE